MLLWALALGPCPVEPTEKPFSEPRAHRLAQLIHKRGLARVGETSRLRGVCDAAALVFLEKKRPVAQQGTDWVARQEDKIIRSLGFMSGELGDHSWCMGTHFSLGDIAVGSALGYLCFRFPDIAWQESHPGLARLYAKLMKRPSFVDTTPHD
jgi:glutathione S-transferase